MKTTPNATESTNHTGNYSIVLYTDPSTKKTIWGYSIKGYEQDLFFKMLEKKEFYLRRGNPFFPPFKARITN